MNHEYDKNIARCHVLRVTGITFLSATPGISQALDNALMFECNEQAMIATVSMTQSNFRESPSGWLARSKNGMYKTTVVPHRGDSEALSRFQWTCTLGGSEATFYIWEEAPHREKLGPGSATVITKLSLKYSDHIIVDSSVISDGSGEYEITKQQFRLSGPEIYKNYPSPQLKLEIQGIGYSKKIRTYANPSIRVSVVDGTYAINRRTAAPLPLTDKSIDPMLTWK